MHILEVVIDGFKSYATRTVISGFDREFNAITGLNGSGKSNILDAICFVLGISNLSQVRASNLQDLVYKQGQAGVTKATVSVIFDNSDPRGSPVGYESSKKVTVTREVVAGGRNRYWVNGHAAQAAQVANLFHSVQLNVNNPHFLIMQGRITKVLNMKPVEILGMIEEAAGTRMFENKKSAALKTLEKKATKVLEIERVLAEEITPTLERLRSEKAKYLKFSSNSAACSRLERFCVAHDYVEAQKNAARLAQSAGEATKNADECRAEAVRVLEEAAEADRALSSAAASDQSSSSTSNDARQRLQDAEKAVVKAAAAVKLLQQQLAAEEASAAERKAEREELDQLRQRLAQATEHRELAADASAAAAAVASAMSQKAPSAMDRVSSLRDQKRETEREIRRLDRAIDDRREVERRRDARKDEIQALRSAEEKAAADLAAATEQLEKFCCPDEDDGDRGVDWEARRRQWTAKANRLETQIKARLANLDAISQAQGVRGPVARLIKPVDRKYCGALETVAGGKLYQIVVEDEKTGKAVLQRSKQRVTLIPLTKIVPSRKLAPTSFPAAIEVVGYDEDLERAMGYAFGNAYVSDTLEQARQVAFGKLRTRCVTLDGDAVSPAGVLTGGATSKSQLLATLYDYDEALRMASECDEKLRLQKQRQAESKQRRLAANAVQAASAKLQQARQDLELEGEPSSSSSSTSEVDVAAMEASKADLVRTAEELDRTASRLEKDGAAVERDWQRQCQAVERCARDAKKRLATATDLETRLSLEVENATRATKQAEDDESESAAAALEAANVELEDATGVRDRAKAVHEAALRELDERNQVAKRRDLLQSKARDLDLETKRFEHNASRLARDASQFERRVQDLEAKHPWIETEKRFFGARGDYDFEAQSAETARERLAALGKEQEELATSVNRRVMGAIESAEKEYEELRAKKTVVENDRAKIEAVIDELDVKKKETLETTWRKVDQNFSSIFSTLLPSAKAKLDPVDSTDILQGLRVKVGFGTIWKESLNELSGGQRSLVALSLVLAMLLFKPAPIYVLDEVDAALDLSHTQNIGTMLKQHFKHAQFIVVSLKEGMFNNANVIFRTKFVDGVSAVSRTSTSTGKEAALLPTVTSAQGDDHAPKRKRK